eukprot:TRINITY_DN1071_c0_g1_i1.p1 TRINITY_DN1071_c0_g1~~TRINITY_DN1071_c0_g1_i1.p1  ORF type:complete len:662 (-),score=141.06 TRINITY_DN1071_c0_g1_i1:77-2062(-)
MGGLSQKDLLREASNSYKLGLELYKRGDYHSAIDHLSHAINCRSGFAKYFFARGNCKRLIKDFTGAIFDYSMTIKIDPSLAIAYGYRGICFRRCLRLDEALSDFSEALKLDPCESHAHNRGLVYSDLELYVRAIEDFSMALNFNKSSFKAYFNRGNTYRKIKRFDKAVDDLGRAVQLNPTAPFCHSNLGLALTEIEKGEEAIRHFSIAIELDSVNSDYYLNRALAYYSIQEFNRAIDDLTVAISLDADNAMLYYSRGNAYREALSFEKSLQDLGYALELRPSDPLFLHSIGLTYEKLEMHTEAVSMFQKVLSIHADFHASLFHLGIMHHKLCQYIASIKCFTRCLEIEPERRVFASRAAVYSDLGDYNAVIKDLTAAIESGETSDPSLLYERGVANYKLNQLNESLMDLRQAIKEGYEGAEVFAALATTERAMGLFTDAIKNLTARAQRMDEDQEVLFARAQCHFDLGNFKETVNDLCAALLHSPNNGIYLFWRGKSLFELKRYEDAVEDLTHALEISISVKYTIDCYILLGLCHMFLENYHIAAEMYTKAIESNPVRSLPPSVRIIHERAKAFQMSDKFGEALEDYSFVLAKDPTNAIAYFRRGFVNRSLHRFSNAAKDFEFARQLMPENPMFAMNFHHPSTTNLQVLCEPDVLVASSRN